MILTCCSFLHKVTRLMPSSRAASLLLPRHFSSTTSRIPLSNAVSAVSYMLLFLAALYSSCERYCLTCLCTQSDKLLPQETARCADDDEMIVSFKLSHSKDEEILLPLVIKVNSVALNCNDLSHLSKLTANL